MSTHELSIAPAHEPALPLERESATLGMLLLIATEAALFALLLFSYFYLAVTNAAWPPRENPKLLLPTVMTILLLSSSLAFHWAEKGIRKDRVGRLRAGLLIAWLLGIGFLTIQYFEYAERLRSLTPQSNAYGSAFYTITSLHGAHVAVGLMMLLFVQVRAWLGHFRAGRDVAVHNVGMYWHFVDIVWLFIFTCLYLSPYWRR